MTEQRTDGTDQYVAGEEAWTIEAPEGVEEDDEEAAFEEMIEMVVPEETALEAKEALPASILPRRMKGDEFTCSSCRLIMARPCLADEERRLCHECALEAASALPLAHRHPVERPCPVCGTSTGAAAALIAAAELGSEVGAVVSRGGRPDLAAPRLAEVRAPTLLIVGGDDRVVLRLNREARALLRCPSELEIVPGATHLFEEPGAIERVGALAAGWFAGHIAGAAAEPSPAEA